VEIAIRKATAADAPALALVGQATFLETYAAVLPAADIVAHCRNEHGEARYAAWTADPACSFWIAQVAETGAPVGYAMLCPPDLPVALQPGDLELKRIYLLSRFHGGGVGRRLMAAALDAARTAGAGRVLLGVYGENADAISFYARQGFARAGVRKFQVGANTYDDLVLARAV
jgi:ribosomal protein S18 acetylase RimI-like enzyme